MAKTGTGACAPNQRGCTWSFVENRISTTTAPPTDTRHWQQCTSARTTERYRGKHLLVACIGDLGGLLELRRAVAHALRTVVEPEVVGRLFGALGEACLASVFVSRDGVGKSEMRNATPGTIFSRKSVLSGSRHKRWTADTRVVGAVQTEARP